MTSRDKNRVWRRISLACILPRRFPSLQSGQTGSTSYLRQQLEVGHTFQDLITTLSFHYQEHSRTKDRQHCTDIPPAVALKLPHKSKAANALLYNDRHFLFTLSLQLMTVALICSGKRLNLSKMSWMKALFGICAVLATLRGSRLQLCVMPAQFLIELAWINWLFIFRSSSLVPFPDMECIAPFIPVMKVENAVAVVITAPRPEQCVLTPACERH